MFHVIVSEKVILKYELQTYLSSFIFLIFSAGQNKPVPMYDVKAIDITCMYNVFQELSDYELTYYTHLYQYVTCIPDSLT